MQTLVSFVFAFLSRARKHSHTQSQVLHNQRADEAVDLSDHSMDNDSVNSAELSHNLQHGANAHHSPPHQQSHAQACLK
jgi:hypothetical protein